MLNHRLLQLFFSLELSTPHEPLHLEEIIYLERLYDWAVNETRGMIMLNVDLTITLARVLNQSIKLISSVRLALEKNHAQPVVGRPHFFLDRVQYIATKLPL